MLKDALITSDRVQDSEGLEFTVLFATPIEAVLEPCASSKAKDPDLFSYYTIDRDDKGVWRFRDDDTIYLVDLD